MSDSATYDNTGAPYNVTRVLTSNFTFNEEGYKEYSPLFIRYVPYTEPPPPLSEIVV